MKRCKSIVSVVALVGLAIGTSKASQAAPPVDEPQVMHVSGGLVGDGTTDPITVILGPLPLDTTMEVNTITTVNRSQESILVQYRFVAPHPTAEDPAGCIPEVSGGTAEFAGVFDELTRVVVPPYSTVHQTFPDSLEIPGQWANSVGEILGTPSPSEFGTTWCLEAFMKTPALGTIGFGVAADVRVSGRIFEEED